MPTKKSDKFCQGCERKFKSNASRKKHMYGCEAVPDDKLFEWVKERTWANTAHPPTLSKKERAILNRAHELERKEARERVSAAGIAA